MLYIAKTPLVSMKDTVFETNNGDYHSLEIELMLLGFISLLLTVFQSPVSKICVPKSVGDSWHPCKPGEEDDDSGAPRGSDGHRRLLYTESSTIFRRILAGGGTDNCPKVVKQFIPVFFFFPRCLSFLSSVHIIISIVLLTMVTILLKIS